jgi:hypothetical protein
MPERGAGGRRFDKNHTISHLPWVMGDAGRERLSLRTTQRRNGSAKRFVYAVIGQGDTAKAKGYDRRRSDLLREPDNSSDGQWASIVTYTFFGLTIGFMQLTLADDGGDELLKS